VTPYLVSSFFILVAAFLCWLLSWHIHGASLILSCIFVMLFGTAAGVAVLWYWFRKPPASAAAPTEEDATELGIMLRLADQRLASAQRVNKRSIRSAPVFYILGADNSAKTTTIIKSGIEPELLAGQAYQDNSIVPTRLANLWYGSGSIFVDAGSALQRTPSLWSTLVRRTMPKLYRSLFGGKPPVRAAVICVSCESFFGSDAANAVNSLARNTNALLRHLARQLGTDLPVYVIVTKLDRVSGFAEYVRNLTTDEIQEPLGVSIPRGSFSDGVYAERAFAVVSSALDGMFFSIGEFRLEMLARESTTANTAAIYQFPRELQKIRNNLANYLVELTRPSHLHVNPYLRGFYGIGVRAYVSEQDISTPAHVRHRISEGSDATRFFSLSELQSNAQASGSQIVTRKVAQWCFLPRLFSGVILRDSDAKPPVAQNRRISLLQRASLVAACSLITITLFCMTVSYRNNAELERAIRDSAAALPAQAESVQLAAESQIATLDRLRVVLLKLEKYERDGAPIMFRWGLYSGHSLINPARRLYFQRFRWLLLASTQKNIVSSLEALPATAPADADYLAAYNPLRAYLITTSYPQYSTPDFLPPVLVQFWLNGQRPESSRHEQLAQDQFSFYASELRLARLYEISPAMPTVKHARDYLNSFGGFDRIYQNMLAAAGRTAPAIDFNRLFPGSAATVVETHVVPGAFTRPGFAYMQNATQHPDRYFTGETWVLGDQAPLSIKTQSLSQQLQTRYLSDFAGQWLMYLRSGSVVRYHGLQDAGQKLQSLSAPNSALLALIYTASHNTAVANSSVAYEFQPTQALVPPDLTNRLIAPGNTTYINSLVGLQGAVSQLTQDATAANNPAATQPVITAAVNAHGAVSQTAQAFNIDSSAHVEQLVVKLMQEPITSVEESLRGAAPEQINLAGRAFCGSFSPLLTKFPFDRNSSVEATPAEVTSALKPGTGLLWQFYANSLKPLIMQQGSQWISVPNAPVRPTAAFLQFFNRVAGLSSGLFAGASDTPTLNFSAHILQSPGIQSVTLAIDSERLSGSDVSRQFTWSARSAQQAQIIASYGNNNLPLQFAGTWSLFHLFDRGRVEQAGNPVRLAYPLEISGTPIVVNKIPLTEQIELSGSAASILVPGSLTGLHCVAQVVH
jgi:type VI secretion system protein ImpL